MIKVENADQGDQRRALITDGVYVNVSATEKEVDELIVALLAWKNSRSYARAGDRYKFEYQETQFNKTLRVESVTGTGPEDLVFFEDGTHSKQGRLNPSMRV